MYSVNGTNITLTRGDTFRAKINIRLGNDEYIPLSGDSLRFAMKKTYVYGPPLVMVDIPIETCILELKPLDTKDLEFGQYVYDIQLTYSNGDIDTFIKGKMRITEEVE